MFLRIVTLLVLVGGARSIVSSQTFRMSSRVISPSSVPPSQQQQQNNLMLIEEAEAKMSLETGANGELRLEAPEGMTHLDVFESFDQDHDGLIDLKEFMAALHTLGYDINEDGALEFFHEADADGTLTLDPDEFAALVEEGKKAVDKGYGGGLAGAELTKCLTAVQKVRDAYIDERKNESGLSEYLKEWCYTLGSSMEAEDPDVKRTAMAWRVACDMGKQQLDISLDKGKPFAPNQFCSGVYISLGTHVEDSSKHSHLYVFTTGGTEITPYAPPVATSACRLQYLKEPRPCCMAHGMKGCHDKSIENCVCAADKHCCENNWDLRCTELVEKIRIKNGNEVIRCGRCPIPKSVDAAALSDMLDEGCG